MLVIEVNFLTGRYVATAHNARDAHEWPPHPARLYSAMVATWAEDGQDEAEREALKWMESLRPPTLASPEAVFRSVRAHFVPVNDSSVVGPAAYERRSRKIDDLEDELRLEMEKGGGLFDRKPQRILDRIEKQRDVTSLVSSAGKITEGMAASAEAMLPERRRKKGRSFPSVTPENARVTYAWDSDLSKPRQDVLDGLLERVTRLGHSSSVVSCRLVSESPTPNLVPGAGSQILRCAQRGQLATLEQRHHSHKGVKPRALPFAAIPYGSPQDHVADGTALSSNTTGDWIVLEFLHGSRRFPDTRAVEVSNTLRQAVFSHAEDPIPEGLSGHLPTGRPSALPHVAFIALPYVGSQYADGRIMGAAVSLPRQLDEAARDATLRAIGGWERSVGGESMHLTFGRDGTLEFRRQPGFSELLTLRPASWGGPSRRWTSVTPIALPANPGALGRGTVKARARAWARAEKSVVAACRHVDLPEPVRVAVSLSPFISAASPAHRFPPFRQRAGDGRDVARRLVHAVVEFAEPVDGPLMLGSGRFIGLGLMRPASDSQKARRLKEAGNA